MVTATNSTKGRDKMQTPIPSTSEKQNKTNDAQATHTTHANTNARASTLKCTRAHAQMRVHPAQHIANSNIFRKQRRHDNFKRNAFSLAS